VEGYEAYVALFAQPPFGPRVRGLLDRRREMVAWNIAITLNTTASLQLFLTNYPNSDFAATARKLLERIRNRLQPGGLAATPVALASAATGPMCPCVVPTPIRVKNTPSKSDDPSPKKVSTPPDKKVDTTPKPPPTRVVQKPPPTTTTKPTRQPQGGGIDIGTVIGIGGIIAGALAGGHGGGGGGGGYRGGCGGYKR